MKKITIERHFEPKCVYLSDLEDGTFVLLLGSPYIVTSINGKKMTLSLERGELNEIEDTHHFTDKTNVLKNFTLTVLTQ